MCIDALLDEEDLVIQLFRSYWREMRQVEEIVPGTWVELTNPTAEEVASIATTLGIDQDDVLAAIDPEEKARVQTEDDYTLIVVDVPAREVRHHEQAYNTIPLGVIVTNDNVLTVCSEETSVLSSLHQARIRDFSTEEQMSFVYRLMLRIAIRYQQVLAGIDRQRMDFEERIEEVGEESDLVRLHELESTLVYFSTSLRGNANVLNRLTRYAHLQQEEWRDVLDDAIVENQQAIEMAQLAPEQRHGATDLDNDHSLHPHGDLWCLRHERGGGVDAVFGSAPRVHAHQPYHGLRLPDICPDPAQEEAAVGLRPQWTDRAALFEGGPAQCVADCGVSRASALRPWGPFVRPSFACQACPGIPARTQRRRQAVCPSS